MKKTLISLLIICAFSVAKGQYNKPYRITYNSAKKSFLICNRGNGTVTELDSTFRTKQVISGLSDPRDLQYARFGTNEGLVILDDNKLKIYDGSYNSVINFSISVASDAESMVFDVNSSGIFYISDKKGNKIIEGKVGPAPFYIPSFKVLTTNGLHRPSGLLIDNKGRLLVVEDSTNAAVLEINKSSGSAKVLVRTGIDSSNSIVQDKEGNYYLSNWSDSYVYRLSPDLGSSRRLAGFSRPSGMLVQSDLDLLLICCTNCGKVDFQKLHWFEPASEVASCVGDSLQIQVSPLFNGVGTFGSGNRFYVDLSDSNGSFTSYTPLGYVLADTNPSSIPTFLPKGNYGSSHRYRLRSTSPAFTSTDQLFNVYPTPRARAFNTDSTSICTGNSIQLGSSSQSDVVYGWSPGELLSDSTSAQVRFSATRAGSFSFHLRALDTLNGCSAESSVFVAVADTISLPTWKQRLRACSGDSLRIGVAGTGYRFTWQPATDLSSDTTDNPYWYANSARRYLVNILDPVNGCSGRNYVDVSVDTLPELQLTDRRSVCAGAPVSIGDPTLDLPTLAWSPAQYLSDTSVKDPVFTSDAPGSYMFLLSVRDGRQCKGNDTVWVENLERPELPEITQLELRARLHAKLNKGNVDSVQIFASDMRSGVYNYIQTVAVADSIEVEIGAASNYRWFRFRAINEYGCESWSDTLLANVQTGWITDLHPNRFNIYPNPTYGMLNVAGAVPSGELKLEIADMNGWVLMVIPLEYSNSTLGRVDLRSIRRGVYFVRLIDVEGNGMSSYRRVVVLPH